MVAQAPEQAAFDACDFTSRDAIISLFPRYMREQIALQANSKKPPSNAINIECFDLKVPFSDRYCLRDTELIVESSRRSVLYGTNGTGKTLLFERMAEGSIKGFPQHIHVHHLKELENHELNDTVLDAILNSHPMRRVLVKCEAKLKDLVATETDAAKLEAYKSNLDYVQLQMRMIQGYDAEERISKMLRVLGFDEVGQKRLVSACSGGLRMRVALAMAFFVDADLLLLDEPTNHLDFPSVLWLENRLRAYRGSFVVVSHDRELLNNVCQNTILIEDQQLRYYQCGFKEFEKKKAVEDKKKYEEIEKFLQKNMNIDPFSPLGRQRHDKKAWSDKYMAQQIAMAGKFTFPVATPLDNPEKLEAKDISLINLKDVTFSYDVSTGHYIFPEPISFNVTASTRCGIMGPNGAGKSTLLKLLTHKLTPVTGTVTHHPKYTLAYFGQHSTAELDLEMTPIEFMCKSFPDEKSGILKNHLNKTGVVGDATDTRMKSLSYSQRSCIVFAKLTFHCPHLLILDEPTNFLDLESVDSLISACNKYQGALLLVSHNRDFLRKCAKQYLSVVPGHFALYDNIKTAEGATYTFIQEMEEGKKIGADILTKVPSGGSVGKGGLTQNSAVSSVTNGVLNLSISTAAPTTMAVKTPTSKPGEVTYAVEEKCQALWTDGKWYSAIVKQVIAGKGYKVLYTDYGNTVTVAPASLRKLAAKPASGAGSKAGTPAGSKPQTPANRK